MGWDTKVGLWWVAIKWKLNFACMQLSSDTPKPLICTTIRLVKRYILTCKKLGVFGWYCCLEGEAVVEWIVHIHLAVNCVQADTQIHCLCTAFNSGSVYYFYVVLGDNQWIWRKMVDCSSYIINICFMAELADLWGKKWRPWVCICYHCN